MKKLKSEASTAYLNVYLISDIGKLLARCNNCGSAAYSDSAAVHGAIGDSFAKFKMFFVTTDKVVLQADTGKYVARCNGCWTSAAYSDAAFIHSTNPSDSWAEWTLTANSDGTYGFLGDNGKYLARCNGCVTGGAKSDFAFVHESNPANSWAKWKIQIV